MNGISLPIFLAVMVMGAVLCYLAGLFIMEILREINPTWVGAAPPPLPPVPRKKTKLIPRRKIPARLLKLSAKAGAAAFLAWTTSRPLPPDLTSVEAIRMKFWPVWARPGNDNIISRAKYWGEKFAGREQLRIEAVPEDLWPLWMRQGNEHILKQRKFWCGSTV